MAEAEAMHEAQIQHVYLPGGELTRHIMCTPESLQLLDHKDITRQLVHLSVRLAAHAIDLDDLDSTPCYLSAEPQS